MRAWTYSLGGPDRGRDERVMRDGVHVATIFADGHYRPDLTMVSLNPLRWLPGGFPGDWRREHRA